MVGLLLVKNYPRPRGWCERGTNVVFLFQEKGVEKYPLPVSSQQRANGGITCRKEEFYRGVR